jgi:hypothetical protein
MSLNIENVLSKYYENIGWSNVGPVPTTEAEYDAQVTTEGSKPTWSELQTKLVEMQSEHDTTEYKRKRALEYPSIIDQLDDIYHNGVAGWKSTIKLTKDKYPKSS